jgi:hypothetical protein
MLSGEEVKAKVERVIEPTLLMRGAKSPSRSKLTNFDPTRLLYQPSSAAYGGQPNLR